MRTTITIDDELMTKASEYTGVKERGALVRLALERLIANEAARRLAQLGGAYPDAVAAPRRRPPDFLNPE